MWKCWSSSTKWIVNPKCNFSSCRLLYESNERVIIIFHRPNNFFYMLQFVCVESLVTAVVDMYPETFRRGYRRELLILGMSIVSFFIGLIMCTEVRLSCRYVCMSWLHLHNQKEGSLWINNYNHLSNLWKCCVDRTELQGFTKSQGLVEFVLKFAITMLHLPGGIDRVCSTLLLGVAGCLLGIRASELELDSFIFTSSLCFYL